jgi:hypothetical protein
LVLGIDRFLLGLEPGMRVFDRIVDFIAVGMRDGVGDVTNVKADIVVGGVFGEVESRGIILGMAAPLIEARFAGGVIEALEDARV